MKRKGGDLVPMGGEAYGVQSSSELDQLVAALNSSRYTGGSTHNFYLYPSRFSPEIAQTIISLFSEPGDSVLDPFMGGGTSIIEGMMLGRRMVGIDLNALAHFVASVRTRPLSKADADMCCGRGPRMMLNVPEYALRTITACRISQRVPGCFLLKRSQRHRSFASHVRSVRQVCAPSPRAMGSRLSGRRGSWRVTSSTQTL